jgi:ABC-type thiamin/hydroxymethylpyrimidine transport system permease subunit
MMLMIMMTTAVTAMATVKMLTVTYMSLGELNESFFFNLHFCIFPFIECHVAAVMAKFKVLFQHLS